MPCDAKWQQAQILRLDKTLAAMRRELIPELSTPFQAVFKARQQLLANLGFKIPRPINMLMKLYGLSPGTITVWHDAESGFFIEARVKVGAAPVYKHISDEVAIAILKGELTKELEVELMAPDEYIGE